MLTVFCWSYVAVILSGGQVKLPAERRGSGVHVCVQQCWCWSVCLCCPLSPLLQSGKAHEGGGGGQRVDFPFSKQ